MNAFLICAVAAAALAAFLFSALRAGLQLTADGAEGELVLELSMLKLMLKRFVFIAKPDPDTFVSLYFITRKGPKKLRLPKRKRKKPKIRLLPLLRSVALERLSLDAEVGFEEDAALTAFLCGSCETAFRSFLPLVSLLFPPAPGAITVSVQPVFGRDLFHAELRGTLRSSVFALVRGLIVGKLEAPRH